MHPETNIQPVVTGNPGELLRLLQNQRAGEPTLTVGQAMEEHVSPNHGVSEILFAMQGAGFSMDETRAYFIGSNIPPRDGST